MKILASRCDAHYGNAPDTFIVEIKLDEIKKVANKFGYQTWKEEDTTKLLKPGAEYDIAAGYNFRRDIVDSTRAMAEGLKKFAVATDTMHRFVRLVDQLEPIV